MSMFYRWMLKRQGLAQTHAVSIQRKVRVRMPDGAELLTDLFLGSPTSAAPAIMMRTPYGRSALFAAGMVYPLAAQGFNVVLQSCRGTFGSTGVFDPHHDEQRDGLATLDWIRQQPWCNGSMATFGLSYLGYTQWAVAAAAGPEVKAMAMQVTLADFSLQTYSGDAFSLENSLSWVSMMTQMKSLSVLPILRFMIRRITGRPAFKPAQWRTLPLVSMDEKLVGERVSFWRDWLQHASPADPWWAPMSHRGSIAQVRRPITMVAGWYDIFLPWQMQDFAALRQAGCEARITVGPWRHTDKGLMQTGMPDAIDWFKHHLSGEPSPRWPGPVKLYVVGADEWRYFDAWPPREISVTRWFLQPHGRLLARMAPESQPDPYRYDPENPTPSVGGPALEGAPFTVDNASLESRADVLSYTSEPMPQARDLIGPVSAEIFASSTAASADFFVRLCDADAAGVSRNICDGLQRVSILAAGVPQRLRVELWPTGYRMAQGHRLRVQISSGAFPRWSRNLGGAEPLGEATVAHIATQQIYHSQEFPSAIHLPFQECQS